MKKYDENRAFALLDKIGFTRVAGSSEELKAAEILKAECESFGLSAVIEPFEIESAEVEATFEILEPYRKCYTVRGYQCAESTAARNTAPGRSVPLKPQTALTVCGSKSMTSVE